MAAVEEPEGDDDVDDKKTDDVDDKKADDINGSKKPFSYDALIFVMIYLCTEPLAFLEIPEEPKYLLAQPTVISPRPSYWLPLLHLLRLPVTIPMALSMAAAPLAAVVSPLH